MLTEYPTIHPSFRPDWGAAEELSAELRFVDAGALMHLTRGLTLNPLRWAEVLDDALIKLDGDTGYVSRVQKWVRGGGIRNGECPAFPGGRVIIDVTECVNNAGNRLHMAAVLKEKREVGMAPVVFLTMQSPVLDVPMRVELALRSVLKGNAPLAGSYILYQHVLKTSDGRELFYYGITKRGWNVRFSEHTRASFGKRSRRLFARSLGDLAAARVAERHGVPDGRPALRGLITAICASGLTRREAMEAEEAMVDKYSLASKHPNGLNMIPGGEAGVRPARRFRQ